MKRRSWVIVIGAIGAILVSAQVPPAGFVSLAWPGENAVEQLEKRYAKVVTYEDPVWVWKGELARNPRLTLPTDRALEAPHPFFKMPPSNPGGDLATDLANVLSVFDQFGVAKFRVQSSKLGLHVIPTLVHDENGTLAPAKNLLDAYVTVPMEERTAYGHYAALCLAIVRATGVKINPAAAFAFGTSGWEYEFGTRQAAFSWGANSETGREAIIDLLDRSATSMSWMLLCYSGADTLHDHTCTFNIREIPISVPDADGKTKDTILLFDRCTKCPPNEHRQLPPKQ